jgi:hypothetical protein
MAGNGQPKWPFGKAWIADDGGEYMFYIAEGRLMPKGGSLTKKIVLGPYKTPQEATEEMRKAYEAGDGVQMLRGPFRNTDEAYDGFFDSYGMVPDRIYGVTEVAPEGGYHWEDVWEYEGQYGEEEGQYGNNPVLDPDWSEPGVPEDFELTNGGVKSKDEGRGHHWMQHYPNIKVSIGGGGMYYSTPRDRTLPRFSDYTDYEIAILRGPDFVLPSTLGVEGFDHLFDGDMIAAYIPKDDAIALKRAFDRKFRMSPNPGRGTLPRRTGNRYY